MPNVLLVGQPIVDYRRHLSSSDIEKNEELEHISKEKINELFRQGGEQISPPCAGGSGTNTLKVLADLGHSCSMLGIIGKDGNGKFFRKALQKRNIEPLLHKNQEESTGICLCSIPPDGDRKMATHPGAAKALSPHHLDSLPNENYQHVHLEGYLAFNAELVEKVQTFVQEKHCTLSFNLPVHSLLKNCQETFLNIIHSKAIDILFCNADEIKTLTNKSLEEGAKEIGSYCRIVVVTKGKHGCYVVKDGEGAPYSTTPIDTKDTTGAGDYFAGGFLSGNLRNEPFETCVKIATACASAIIQVEGTDLPPDKLQSLKITCHEIGIEN